MTLLPSSFHGERCYGIRQYTMLSNYLHSVDYVIKHDCLWASSVAMAAICDVTYWHACAL